MADPPDVSYLVPAFEIKIDGTKLETANQNIITSVTISKGIAQADHFSFQVQDVMENGAFKWLGNDLFKFGKKVNIDMGYVGDLTHSIEAHIDSIAPNFSTGLAPSFKVEGSHKGFALLTEASEHKVFKKGEEGKKDNEIVSEIAGLVGLSAVVDETGETEPDPNKSKKAGKSYWDYIQSMAKAHKEFEVFIENGTLNFRKAKLSEAAVLTLTWGKHLLSFNTSLDVSKLVSEVIVLGRNGIDDKDIEGKATAGSESMTKLGEKFGSEIAQEVYGGDKKKYIVRGAVDDKAEGDNNAQAQLESASSKLITGQGKTLGLPGIKPGVCIELAGLGDWFNGKYYIEKTEQTISTSGYETSFSVWRNAL